MNLPFLRRLNRKKTQQQAQQIEERPFVQITVSTSPIIGDTCLSYETALYEGSILRTSTTSTDDSSISSSVFVDTATNQNVLNCASQDPSILLHSSKPSELPSEYTLQSHDSLQTANQTETSTTSHDSCVESNASLFSHDEYSLLRHDSIQTFNTSESSLTTSYSNQSQATDDSLLFHVALTKNGCQVQWCHCDHYN